jgi:hypothetical protein
MSLHGRLAKLEAIYGRPGQPCPDPRPTVILTYAEGEPEPAVPAEAVPCRYCGAVHVLRLEEVVIDRCRRCGKVHAIRSGCGERAEASAVELEHGPAAAPEGTPCR